jgi:hypothetical protein
MSNRISDIQLRKTAHILIAWELGGGLGHITRVAAIARGLSKNGCRVSLVLRNLARIEEFVAHPAPALFQAPLWQSPLRTEQEPVCFSDILLHHGYGSARGLFTMVGAWQNLFGTLGPDLLLAD